MTLQKGCSLFVLADAELQVTGHFSFLCGVSSTEELFAGVALAGISALGMTDRNSLAGVVPRP